MKKVILSMFCVFLLCSYTGLFAQEISLQQQRIEKVEQKIRAFTQKNIQNVPEEQLTKYKNSFELGEHGFLFNNLSDQEKREALDAYKVRYLRNEYFRTFPNDADSYTLEMAPVCLNGDFEDGNFNNFQGFSAIDDPGGHTFGECGAVPTTGVGNFAWNPVNIFSGTANFGMVTAGTDPLIAANGGTLNRVNNGNFAARINASTPCTPDHGIDRLVKPITLQESGDQQVRFSYALVAEFPSHPNENPFFIARALDANGVELDRLCVISNPANNPFFNQINNPVSPNGNNCNYTTILWQDWTCGILNISGNAGDIINLEFIAADCARGGHFGYAYVDDICAESCEGGPNFQGSIELDPFDPCEVTLPFDVCAAFTLPQLNGQTGTINSTSLDILQNGQVQQTLTNGVITGNQVCFTVNANDFPSQTGGYDFRVNVTFNIGSGTQDASDTQTTPGQNNDYIFNNPDCCDIAASVTNVVCYDQGTTDPSDDTWSFDLTVTNSAGTFWNATTPNSNSGGYGGTSTIYMGLISGYNNLYGFQVSDDADPSCSVNLAVAVPEPCSPPCELDVEVVIGECDDNGTPSDYSDDFYNVSVTVTGTNGLPWMAKQKLVSNGNEIVLDNVTGDVTNYSLGSIDVSDGNWTLWIGLTDYFDCLEDIFIEVPNCCNDEPYISPYWQHPACPEVVCTADQWPIHVLSSDGTPITSAGGIMISWDNLDTPVDENILGDFIYASPLENWQATITYPNGCEYIITYFEDCCDEDIFIRVLECPTQGQVQEYAVSLEKELAKTTSLAKAADAVNAQQAQVQAELDLVRAYMDAIANSNGEDCDPCDLGIVFIELVDAAGNVIDPNDYLTFSWSDGGFGAMRAFPLPMSGPVCFTATNIEYGKECVYQDCFFYECEEPCPVPTDLRFDCRSAGMSWTGDPSLNYVIEVTWDDPSCCEPKYPPTATRWEVTGTSTQLPFIKNSNCLSWKVGVKCKDEIIWSDSQCVYCYGVVKPTDDEVPHEPTDVKTEAKISPNPNDGNMNIEISGKDKTNFMLKVYRFDGVLIKSFDNNRIENTATTITWNGRSVLTPGMYFFVITTDTETITKKVVIK
ncbi:hypothetical protein KORDIASMS9_00804 [Kordia sp. SMS9]|uniref:T9SS type A sorting domain-containing protein n=1 Tax=Kordia sp. SMS9 TaxID=2282170 RepID=UPI000E0DA56F|nr:T9SS type A sorting domain-containing protein [Kordia sp. SMS9]AXG68589.1 hypothetical protein KORDIASMS9_00804 [Kordia sp. SMS9]